MAERHEPVHETWLHSDRRIPTRFVRPALRFMETETAGGIVILVAAVIALVWANSPWGGSYTSLWGTELEVRVGDWFHFAESLKDIVNDGLMVIFFFVVGLEIKRELAVGELNSVRKATLPAIAAFGGMVVPALIFLAFVLPMGDAAAARGWGIPMATDIAFSVGVLALVGHRVPLGAKLFLLALAIVDDIGAILVIAVFYTAELSLVWLGLGVAGLVVVWLAKRAGIRSLLFYGVVGVAVWFAFLESGVHATIAGVALGLLTPAEPLYAPDRFRHLSTWLLGRFDMDLASPQARARLDHDALELAAVAKESVSPLKRLELSLHGWSAFVVVPLFALANAGVRVVDVDLGEALTGPVFLGVMLGLLVGKPVGITVASWIGLRLRLGQLPRGAEFRHVAGLGLLAGVGFTVALFVTELAFGESLFGEEAKMGIFAASLLAGVIGFVLLRLLGGVETPRPDAEPSSAVLPAAAAD